MFAETADVTGKRFGDIESGAGSSDQSNREEWLIGSAECIHESHLEGRRWNSRDHGVRESGHQHIAHSHTGETFETCLDVGCGYGRIDVPGHRSGRDLTVKGQVKSSGSSSRCRPGDEETLHFIAPGRAGDGAGDIQIAIQIHEDIPVVAGEIQRGHVDSVTSASAGNETARNREVKSAVNYDGAVGEEDRIGDGVSGECLVACQTHVCRGGGSRQRGGEGAHSDQRCGNCVVNFQEAIEIRRHLHADRDSMGREVQAAKFVVDYREVDNAAGPRRGHGEGNAVARGGSNISAATLEADKFTRQTGAAVERIYSILGVRTSRDHGANGRAGTVVERNHTERLARGAAVFSLEGQGTAAKDHIGRIADAVEVIDRVIVVQNEFTTHVDRDGGGVEQGSVAL